MYRKFFWLFNKTFILYIFEHMHLKLIYQGGASWSFSTHKLNYAVEVRCVIVGWVIIESLCLVTQVATYFWFLGDLFIVCLFAISFTTAYRWEILMILIIMLFSVIIIFRYIHLRRKLEANREMTESQIQMKLRRSIYKHVMCKKNQTHFMETFV